MAKVQQWISRNTYIFALLLLVIVVSINYALQNNLFELRVLNGNLRVFLPLILLAVGQAVVIIGGGVDLSVGTMVSMLNALFVTVVTAEADGSQIALGLMLVVLAGLAAGLLNGFCVAYLRLQPMVTTYATSFIFAGIALYILPRPGGALPRDIVAFYRSTPLEIPLAFFVIGLLMLLWWFVRGTRYAQYLFSTGSSNEAAYTTGVPVRFVRLTTYLWSGLFAAFSAIALTASVGTGNPRIGDAMTLDSVVAVILGGTSLRGGQGGILGAVMGVIILGVIRNIISFANVPTWWQTLVNALIIIAALAAPGILSLIRKAVAR